MPKLEDIQRFLEQEESKPDGLVYTDPEAIKARKRILVWIGRKLGGSNTLEDIPHYISGYLLGLLTAGAIGLWLGSSWLMFLGGSSCAIVMAWAWKRRPSWCFRSKKHP